MVYPAGIIDEPMLQSVMGLLSLTISLLRVAMSLLWLTKMVDKQKPILCDLSPAHGCRFGTLRVANFAGYATPDLNDLGYNTDSNVGRAAAAQREANRRVEAGQLGLG